MSVVQVRQLQSESDAWKRTLGFLREENVFLKQLLTEVVKDSGESGLLEVLENFQTQFLREDERFTLLRNDIANLEESLYGDVTKDDAIVDTVQKKMQELRINMRITEQEFSRLKTDFHQYLRTGLS